MSTTGLPGPTCGYGHQRSPPELAFLGDDILNPDFCGTCRTMFSRDGMQQLTSRQGFQHLTDTALQRSAGNGCRFCCFFLETVERVQRLGLKVFHTPGNEIVFCLERDIQDMIGTETPFSIQQLVGYQFPRNTKVVGGDMAFAVYALADDPCATFVPRRPVHSDFTSDIVMSAAHAFLSDCKNSHVECATSETPRLPTRVIDVGGPSCASNEAKLHITTSDERHEYVTLSYCWGGPQPVRLTEDKLSEFTNGIDLDSLPQTLKDAVATTRRLGFRYLWIDALCIIQDSEDDKIREVGKMGEVYRNSTITLSASRAETVHGGFSPAIPHDQGPTYKTSVEVSLTGGEQGSMVIAVPERNDFRSFPINQRAWTLQEYMLSRRILAFGDEVAWVCARRQYQPLIPSPIDHTYYFPPKSFDTLSRLHVRTGTHEGTTAAAAWDAVVQNFCRRGLSFPEDRVHAITGIIKMLEPAWMDECYFGLWKGRFLTDLAWCVDPIPGLKRSSRAPSWSWMSLDHKLVHSGYRVGVPDGIFVSAEGKRVKLRAKLLPAMADSSIAPRVSVLLDLHEGDAGSDTAGKPLHFIYLGEDLGTGCGLGLVVVEMDPDCFRRVGFFEMQDRGTWKQVPNRTIILE